MSYPADTATRQRCLKGSPNYIIPSPNPLGHGFHIDCIEADQDNARFPGTDN